MGRLLIVGAFVALAGAQAAAAASGFDASIDLRGVASDGERSFLDGGLGKLRFDDHHEGLQLGDVRLGYRGDFLEVVHFNVQVVSYADHDRNPLDLTEAYAEIRPFPRDLWRSRLKVGAFYAPISLENRLRGWRSAYCVSSSAINTWVGEELRTIGAEYDLDWLGQQRGHDWELGVVGGVYGWNEAAGALIAKRGWALHDRQTTLFGRTGSVAGVREFYAYPGQRAGYYVGASARYRDSLELRTLHYDNRANPAAYASAIDDYAWHTRFDSAGLRWTPSERWTLIAQWLDGDTSTGTDPYRWTFHAAFLLASWQRGADRLSARYDRFEMRQLEPDDEFHNSDSGHAWTFAYERELNRSWSVALEALQIDSDLAARTLIGVPAAAVERELQLAVRLEL